MKQFISYLRKVYSPQHSLETNTQPLGPHKGGNQAAFYCDARAVQKMELGYSLGLWDQIGFLERQQKKTGSLKIFKELKTPKGEFPTIEVKKTEHLLSPKRRFLMKNSAKCTDFG